jgi:hypothetical protein
MIILRDWRFSNGDSTQYDGIEPGNTGAIIIKLDANNFEWYKRTQQM